MKDKDQLIKYINKQITELSDVKKELFKKRMKYKVGTETYHQIQHSISYLNGRLDELDKIKGWL